MFDAKGCLDATCTVLSLPSVSSEQLASQCDVNFTDLLHRWEKASRPVNPPALSNAN